ncbi:FMN-dependent NADH-azoreductase [Undibacterium sp. Rencai35W]|uniref:FMN-dependent NADH-azoreductase n=1 Tax=Undibacterium sp. Rencai35W TaxID=3413046 RepID=UPI003BF00B9F
MKLLHLDSSILGADSVSRNLSAEIVSHFKSKHPEITVIARDLASDPALHLSGTHLAIMHGVEINDDIINADIAKGNAYLEELFDADVLVIGTPMYNLSIPTSLKAWIDRIAIAGKTFQYTATGPEGLLKNKKAIIASARGGVYSAGSPAAAIEHQECYLVGLLGFLGVTDVTIVRAEGLAFGPDVKAAALKQASVQIASLEA